MKTFSDVYQTLRRKNKKQYALLCSCLFFSVLLISSYLSIMRSPTVLSVLPEGGDSRKQVMMIFTLTMIGCGVFSLYAANLFFRQKSKEFGIFLALGTSQKVLTRQILTELCVKSIVSCTLGMIISIPLTKGIWALFRLFIVDTEEMILSLNPRAFIISLLFSIMIIIMLLFMGVRSIHRINIIDIIHESHKSEPIQDVPRIYGPLGILLLIIGALLGYLAPSFFILILRWYPPDAFTAVFYLPAFVGMYMVLLHTVVNGWRSKRHAYKDLIATSQMKFQGRQTVQNLLVMSLLIAGAYFASFYTPMLGIGAGMSYDKRPFDYLYHFRMDQDIPRETEVRDLAKNYNVKIKDWYSEPMIRLAVDGTEQVETTSSIGTTYECVYLNICNSDLFLSESSYTKITGEKLNLTSGEMAAIFDSDGNTQYTFAGNVSLLTNTFSKKTLKISSIKELKNDALFGHYVLNNTDYSFMNEGLNDEWRETICLFNVEDCEQTYDFAKTLFNTIVDHSDSKVEIFDSWDPVRKQISEENGKDYFLDPEHLQENGLERIDYNERDSSAFRLYWQYMPQFRVLDKADFVKTMAVFLMLFIFISIVCFAAVFVIAFTRSMTIAITEKRIYNDLRHLGASNQYLYQIIRSQLKRVFVTPAIIGTAIIFAFYIMIMFFNDNRLSVQEIIGVVACAVLVFIISVVFYGIYRFTLRKVCTVLDIN